ncbi:MAG: metalloregulator ArsR/SmtB family transcription factor [Chitinophagaceae bacterium]
MRRDTFKAIADPTRRKILGIVARRSFNINAVADNFTISRTAVCKHIKILTECGLITIRQQGRERYCEARMKELCEVWDWVSQYSSFWNNRLDRQDGYLASMHGEKASKTAKKKTSGHAVAVTTARKKFRK